MCKFIAGCNKSKETEADIQVLPNAPAHRERPARGSSELAEPLRGRDAVARLVSHAPGYAAFNLVSTRTSSPARANRLMSLSTLNRLISPLSRLLIRG